LHAVNLPDILNGEEFYAYKMVMAPEFMSLSEIEVYNSGKWTDYYDLCLRTGNAQQHNISVSGGTQNSKYFISGGVSDVKGITVNDDYLRLINRINIEMDVNSWLTLGTRSQFSYDDLSGVEPSFSLAHDLNPLTKGLNEDGSINMYPWEGRETWHNPLQTTFYKDIDESFQIITNNFAVVNFPFLEGLSYRINTGFRFRYYEKSTYRGRNTGSGATTMGRSDNNRARNNNTVIENIFSYNKEIGRHALFATALYSFEGQKNNSTTLQGTGYPNDILTWFAIPQADLVFPGHEINESYLISQMLRLNYNYDSRYLFTLTGRRDGFSGFGAQTKWGVFPSVALGWNLANEDFFPYENLFDELKLRASYGLNGNQAVGVYKSITRLEEYNIVDDGKTVAGYIPSVLGDSNLGWESSLTWNVGLDFGILKNRISGTINVYKTNTNDLLLNRTISPTHGITSIITNIGETENTGLEFSINSRNIALPNFSWITSGNISYMKNKIISLYGILDSEGHEVDDVANRWFIGKPINVNYDFKINGVWQLDEAEEAAKWNSQPGYIKYEDVNGDYLLDADDMQIIGQQDPKYLWGMSNIFTYKNLNLNIYVHGVHGVTIQNSLMEHTNGADCRGNVTRKNYWTPDNPTNDYPMLAQQSHVMAGVNATNRWYENASFVRIKDVSLSYNLKQSLLERIGLSNLRIYVAGKNLYTLTNYKGTDPELAINDINSISPTHGIPLQREFIFGLEFGF
jgi:TonB-linked SusC/RagA family outer membrane protein